MEKIRATIILLTYNQEQTIARALESLLRQRCDFRYEILVADDASPDSTRAICEEYARKYPEIVRMMPQMPNRGIVGNYFDAYEAAAGDYIADCAGDDEWLDPERLQRSIEILDADSSLSAVFTDVEICENGKCRLASSLPEHQKWLRDRVPGREILIDTLNNTDALPFTLSAALYRKSAVEKVYAVNKEIVRCPEGRVEDLPLIAAIGYGGDVAYLPIVGYRYYIEGVSVSNNLDYERQYRFYAPLLSVVKKLADFYGIPLKELRTHFRVKTTYLAGLLGLSGNKSMLHDFRQRYGEWRLPLPLRARLHLLLASLRAK